MSSPRRDAPDAEGLTSSAELRARLGALQAAPGNGSEDAHEPPAEDGEVLAKIPRRGGESLHVVLHTYRGKRFVRFQVWREDKAGKWWPMRGVGFALRSGETADVAAAMVEAAERSAGRK